MTIIFLHMLTHAILGACLAFVVLRRKDENLLRMSGHLLFGAFFGVFPDLLGFRDATPWSHSFIITPITVIIPVLLGKLFYRNYRFVNVYFAAILATSIGHLLMDFFQHPITALYPLSASEYGWKLVELGDPWLWLPLLLGMFCLLFTSTKKYGLPISLAIVFSLLCVKAYFKVDITQELEHKYRDSEAMIIQVHPAPYNHINIFKPFDWFAWRYDVIGKQRYADGYMTLTGSVHDGIYGPRDLFYPDLGQVVKGPSSIYRIGSEDDLEHIVLQEVVEHNKRYLICNIGDEFAVYSLENEGWEKVESEIANSLIETHISTQGEEM